jgi:AbrB family looped-hinge helix DNA binding protein
LIHRPLSSGAHKIGINNQKTESAMQVSVSDKGQITLPQALRKQLGIEPGTLLQVDTLDDGSLRVRILTRGSQGLAGLLHRPERATISLEAMDEAVALQASELDTLTGSDQTPCT